MRQADDEIAMLFHALPSTAGLAAKRGSTTQALPAARLECTPIRVVGRVRVELTTSRLSGVRSNHLSYRPSSARYARQREQPRRQSRQSRALWRDTAALAELPACKIASLFRLADCASDEGT